MKWIEMLQGYIFVLKHKPRKENKVVDALSKRALASNIMKNEAVIFAQINEK
jgi:hypothetical protein